MPVSRNRFSREELLRQHKDPGSLVARDPSREFSPEEITAAIEKAKTAQKEHRPKKKKK